MKVFVALLALLLGSFIFQTHSQIDQLNKSFLQQLYFQFSARFAQFYNRPGTEPELFLLNMPGTILQPDDFNQTAWSLNSFEAEDPEYLAANLVDEIPVYSPIFRPSGRKVSKYYKRLFQSYYTKEGLVNFNDATYQSALRNIFNTTTWAPSVFLQNINDTRTIVRESATILTNKRNACLKNEPFISCARKAVEWQREIDKLNSYYVSTRRQLASFQSTIISLHAKNIDHIITSAYQTFLANTRAVYGSRSYLENYQQTTFDPSDFWCWFRNSACASNGRFFWTAFYLFPIPNWPSFQYQKARFPSANEYNNNLFGIEGITSSTSANRQYLDATNNGDYVYVYLNLAQITVNREWFNPSLFNFYPLGVKNVRNGNWSNGDYRGEFPWYITKIIVARNIFIYPLFRNWNSNFLQMMERVRTNPKLKANYGPFTFSSARTKYNNMAYTFSPTTRWLTISGPQIIGYVVNKLPKFPNYEEEQYFYKK